MKLITCNYCGGVITDLDTVHVHNSENQNKTWFYHLACWKEEQREPEEEGEALFNGGYP